MARSGKRVLASRPEVAAAMQESVARGNAVDAVITGALVAAALSPSVLLGPIQLLVVGSGAGERAVDGRCQQSGLGNPRPRGFQREGDIPPAARVAVPGLPYAVPLALASFGTVTLSRAVAPSVDAARAVSKERAASLAAFGRLGPAYLSNRDVTSELVHCAGRLAGGNLSEQDLADALPAVETARCRGDIFTVPWGAFGVVGDGDSGDGRHTEVVAARDHNGLVAMAAYESHTEALPVESLGLALPLLGEPVRRHIPRELPGTRRDAAAPMAVLRGADGDVLGYAVEASLLAEEELRRFLESLSRDAPDLLAELPRGVRRV